MLGTAPTTADPGELPEQYVINLCASTTPMALEQPKAEVLRRFTFFVSRRREDGRERFRLHMGYFGSPAEAEEWLGVVRELYPAAWIGEAPGKKLRAAARAAAGAPATPPGPPALPEPASPEPASRAADPAKTSAPAPAPARTPAPPPTPDAAPTPIAAPTPAPPAAPFPIAPPAATPAPVRAPAQVPTVAPRIAARAAPPPASPPAPPAVAALSNVREVLAQLDSTDPPAREAAHTLYVPPPPVLPEHIPTVQALTPAPMVAPSAKPPAKPAPAVPPTLSDTQVLRVLEEHRADGADKAAAPTPAEREAGAAIEMLRPDDTRTMRALREEVQQNAPPQFAVQLSWSVTPIDLANVPPLAIFSAYTLYTVESTREGRRWYGLRLGFFSDALSAKQVAYYVRSDFASVAVVPVTALERDNAIASAREQPKPAPRRDRRKANDEFKLFDVDPAPAKPAPSAQAVRAKLAEAARAGKRPAAGTRAKPAPRRKARTLEESLEQTLEILGAGELEIDKGRGELLNDSGVRHLSVKVDKRTSTFAKLLDRLSDRVGKA